MQFFHGNGNEVPSHQNPRETSNPLSSFMFCGFLMPIFFKSHKKLSSDNLHHTLAEHKSDYLSEKLNAAWEDECLRKQQKYLTPSLAVTLVRVFGARFALFGAVLFMLEIGLRFSSNNNNKEESQANYAEQITTYLYAMGVILCSAANVLLMHPYMLGVQHIGMDIEVAISGMIYRKTLRLSKTVLESINMGQVTNLIANDAGRLNTTVLHMHYLWLGPVEIVIITYFMYREIGTASFFGVTIMLIFLPIQVYLSKRTSALRLHIAQCADERVGLMNEIITGIQVIKMYAWERSFSHLINVARIKELNAIQHINYVRAILQSFILFVTRLSVFASLVGFVLLGRLLTADKAFAITAYYNILRTTMAIYFPMGLTQFTECLISIQRIQKYMMCQESKVRQNTDLDGSKYKLTALSNLIAPFVDSKNLLDDSNNYDTNCSINVNKLKAKWDNNGVEYILDSINLKVNKNHVLVVITGSVGAGKSSLLQAILGELPIDSGSITVRGNLSYAPQEPWLFKGTIRQNILFGLPMEKYRYRVVLKKCALDRDFNLMPYGDHTVISERGVPLSGGQKARINLARALYRQANIYLLDDPFAAVDINVGRQLFDECVRDFLSNNIVLLVTHQFQFLEKADLVVIMDKGRITAKGSFESVTKTDEGYFKFLVRRDKMNTVEDISTTIGNASIKKVVCRQSNSKTSEYRDSSITSLASSVDEGASSHNNSKAVQIDRQQNHFGGIKLLKKYFIASGGYGFLSFMVLICISAQIFASGGDYFLSYWINKSGQSSFINDSTNKSDTYDLGIFAIIHIALVVLAISRSLLFFNLAKRSSIAMHNNMFVSVIGTAMHFFNNNATGCILNRFSKDLHQIDEILPGLLMDVIQLFLALFGIVVVLCLVNIWYLFSTIFVSSMLFFLREFYLSSSRDVKRLEATNRSLIYTHLATSLNGLSIIRAFNAHKLLIAKFDNYQDLHTSSYNILLTTNRAFGYWLDCCCALYISLITLSFFVNVLQKSGDIGLAITQAMGLTNMVQWSMRQSAELENTLTVIERVKAYENLQSERDEKSSLNRKPPKSWPEHGNIIFDNLSLRYSRHPKTEYALKSLSFEVKSYEKVGIVGRTGAGKSSLIKALFNLAYNDGSIVIDLWNTRDIPLQDLRSKISIIPQEPVLFSGSVRFNLDPLGEYTDAKLWEVLQEVKMKQVIFELPSGMQSRIAEGGINFSVGQRQLICLARAILRENRILVMDEATASVDPQTDAFIRTTIKDKFKQCTVLTIAHRLHTVIDSDKVLVMEAGRIVEYGAPFELLTTSKTKVFYSMVKQMGDTSFDNLLNVAQKAHEENLKVKKDPYSQIVMVPKVFKNYILKILEPITNHPANIKVQNTKLFFDNAKPKF